MAPQIDILDYAYLTLGAHAALESLNADDCETLIEEYEGHSGIMDYVLSAAFALAEVWHERQQANDDPYGVWYYEVSEPFGRWLIMQRMDGHVPSTAELKAKILSLWNEMQK